MRIGILSVDQQSYSTQRLCAAAQQRGHEVLLINTLQCHLHVNTQNSCLYYQNQKVENLDLVIPRIGASLTFHGTQIVRQFEILNIPALNTADAINRARNKLQTLQLFSQHNIPIPHSIFAHHEENNFDNLPDLENSPYLIKPITGTQGKHMILAQDDFAIQAAIIEMRMRKKKFLLQQFLTNADDTICDIRSFVIGDRIITSIKRQAKAGEFRANLHCGGAASMIELTSEEQILVLKAVSVLGLSIAGVDMLRTAQGPVILEVNASPGLEGIEIASGLDIAGKVIEYGQSFIAHHKFLTPFNCENFLSKV